MRGEQVFNVYSQGARRVAVGDDDTTARMKKTGRYSEEGKFREWCPFGTLFPTFFSVECA